MAKAASLGPVEAKSEPVQHPEPEPLVIAVPVGDYRQHVKR